MSDANKPFAFSQFVPGFDFLKNLAGASASPSAVPGLPSLSSWVAPTLSVEEVDKRIQELKTVQYWLEQNGHALKATIQALEVQKMTLSTLRGMNVRMEDLASAFTRPPAPEPASRAEPPAPAAEPEPEAEPEAEAAPARKRAKAADGSGADGAGVVDPLQWWGALTQQFQQIASSALQDASQIKVPTMADAAAMGAGPTSGKSAARPAAAAPKKAAPARGAAAAKRPASARKRAS
ncbi:PhaM family polyhydroxyalkanoate granule multifunctional regulatory protein [Variovorax saccharolyticus]|uniref:PhaM family polyhydroxyalkanoate granule multifunctional regulatory protein n=1 Tax=Variovorax saccharolyticus TaxID=3053516 RepID=UPI002578F939|nr:MULTISPECIES: PhaM family polyhydroxyalkanoate granule multifunctional regulatory protein [unclassified Variovorax]MDM0017390.1 hypothetical protein [Variovorax sp. J22R187]MDM0026908.1 hypothetical protein [Variovorax sp. J31P216]